MENLLVCVNAVLPIFLLLMVGYLARILKLVDDEDVRKINRLMFKLFMPAVMFYSVYNSDLSSAVRPRLLLYTVAAVLSAFGLSCLAARWAVRERNQKGVFIQGVFRSNFVIIGIPIVSSLMGDVDMGPVAVLLAVVVPLFNVLSVIILQYYNGQKPEIGKMLLAVVKNPLILGTVAGILAVALKLRLPVFLVSAVRQLSQAASAVLLVMLGAFFKFDGLSRYRRELSLVCLGRLVIVPGIFLGLAGLLGFRGVEMAALLGVFASSTAVNSFTMAQQMGGDAELAGDIVVATSALCSFTLFGWGLLLKTLGLL
ncbi:MAG: AEC family transporter [Oscillospiraceae bacterium]|nr:AEC family transporter [Oscillospiraceae bacterium]